jgi:hypothetical protein
MMKVVQIGKTPPLYATADYQTEKERIMYVLRFTLRMQVGGARRGICAGNEFDRFVKRRTTASTAFHSVLQRCTVD